MALEVQGRARPEAVKTDLPRSENSTGIAKVLPKMKQQSFASYYRLVKKFPLVPIRDDVHLGQALAVVEELLKCNLDEGADSYLDVLNGLIEAYESRVCPIPDVSEADVLRELMRQNSLSQSMLEAKIGIAQPTISAVLRGARGLTKEQIVALARFFQVSPGAFLPAR